MKYSLHRPIKLIAVLLITLFFTACSESNKKSESIELPDDYLSLGLERSLDQLKKAIEINSEAGKFPRSTNSDGSLHAVDAYDWTSGFYPGLLWYAFETSGDSLFLKEAVKWTDALEEIQYDSSTHDLGFMLYCSYGNAIRLTGDEMYAPILEQGARTLITRYNEKTGCIQSWGSSEKWQFPVIIDNMMNLEYLFYATKTTGDSLFYDIAISHADKTIEHHFRDDGGSVHVVDYNPETGEVNGRFTHQGYSDNSSWSRGQSWGLYGYIMTFRETGEHRYLEKAESIAQFLLNHPNYPQDGIPYWDYDAPGIPDVPRDAAAASIMASALIELSEYSETHSNQYLDAAKHILQNLTSSKYLSEVASNQGFILKHATGHFPAGSEIDISIIYADYYYLEALLRLSHK